MSDKPNTINATKLKKDIQTTLDNKAQWYVKTHEYSICDILSYDIDEIIVAITFPDKSVYNNQKMIINFKTLMQCIIKMEPYYGDNRTKCGKIIIYAPAQYTLIDSTESAVRDVYDFIVDIMHIVKYYKY